MRNLITDYSFEPNTRTITLDKFANLSENNPFSVENIRLIVNETQKVVVCSSMQKDNIIAVEGNTITYTEALAPLNFGDQLTIEVDMGDGFTYVDSGDWVINAKLEALKPIEEQKAIDIDGSKGMAFKALVEDATAPMITSFFEKASVKRADLSSWTKIVGPWKAYNLFHNAKVEDADLSSLQIIGSNSTEEAAAMSLFEKCVLLKHVNVQSLTIIQGNTATGNNYNHGMFYDCAALQELNMSNLTSINGVMAAITMCKNCISLTSVNFDNLETISGNQAFTRAFDGCLSLKSASFPKLRTISGNTVMGYAFMGCKSLKYLNLSALTEAKDIGCIMHMCDGCSSLESVDLRSLIFWTASDGNGPMFQNCPSLTDLRINCKILSSNSASNNLLAHPTAITDLYLYGDATNSIYLSWQGSLNFNSVCGVLKKLCENTDANGLVCAFKSGFTMTDQTSHIYTDGDGVETPYSNETGVLKALYDEAVGNGWTIQNLKINPVK